MKPTVLMPAAAMWVAMASDIMMSFCGVLKTQRRLASTGSTIAAEAAIEIIGVCDSAATSIIASEFGGVVAPSGMAMLFFSGMPSEAAGPVAETVTPTLMSASETVAAAARPAATRAVLAKDMKSLRCDDGSKSWHATAA